MRVTNVHGPGEIRIDEAAAPSCGPDDVVVAMKACGICGTDLAYVRRGGRTSAGGRCPMPLGHEPAGEVLEVGANLGDLAPGTRVVFNPVIDETDPIGNGGSQGALSDRVLIRNAVLGHNLFGLPASVPYEVAALTEPLAVALHAVNRADPQAGQTAVVFGAGPVGVGIVAWLTRRGVHDIVVVDRVDERLGIASKVGAHGTINARDDVLAHLRSRHGGARVWGTPVAGTDLWFDAAGSPRVIDTIVSGAKRHATAVVVAVHQEPVPFDLGIFLAKEMRFTSAIAYPTEFGDVVAAITHDWAPFAPMVTDRVPFAQVADAIALAGSGRAHGKVTVIF
jgi:threonine dehydrogenase-like Zn-dependent dehydrogenase